MPRQLSVEDAKRIGRANALLSGNAVYGTWEATVIASSQEFEAIWRPATEGGACIELEDEEELELEGQRIVLGRVVNRLLQAMLADTPPGSPDDRLIAFTLRSGSDKRVEVELRLSDEDRANLPDGRLNTLLETYAGRWVAKDGARILFDADSPEEVIEELQRRGEVATVWRVPASKVEAAARPVFA